MQVGGLSGVAAIAAGGRHTVVLKNDGTVWAWGNNSDGQLGDGTAINRKTPVQVSGLGGVTTAAAGSSYTVVLKNDGTVWAWGYNNSGQLGDGTTTNRKTPVQASGLGGVTAIAAGGHTVALKNDGTVWAWGYNNSGQLGDGTTTNRKTPVQVGGLSGIAAIASGNEHTVALKNDGTVWTWGDNYDGQLGNGGAGYYALPKWSFGTPADTPLDPAGKEFHLVLKAQNFTSLIGRTFTVRYVSGDIANITDLCAMTYRKETTIGVVQGTGITITQVSPGTIKFTVDRVIESGRTWSGVLNIITFIPAVSGPVTFTVAVE